MSNNKRNKANLRRTREQLHAAHNVIKQYKQRIAGDNDKMIDYVQGIAAFGEYAAACLASWESGQSSVVYSLLVAYAQQRGIIIRMGDKWEATHLCNKEEVNAIETPEPAEAETQTD